MNLVKNSFSNTIECTLLLRISGIFAMLLFLSFSRCNDPTSKVIDLMDYGIESNSGKDATPAIIQAIADATKYENAIIKFPGGQLDLRPEEARSKEYYVSNATEDDTLSKVRKVGILLENMSNITLEGNGTLLMSHGKMIHLAIDHCKNVKVQGLRFDYQNPTMSEMEIQEVDSTTVVGQIHHDSQYKIEHDTLSWVGEGWTSGRSHTVRFSPDTEIMLYDSWKPFATSQAEEIEPNKVRFRGDFSKVKFQVGDILTIRDPYRDCIGVLNYFSKQVAFDSLQLHYMHGMGIVSQFSEDITLNNVKVQPRAESGRKIAAFADCFHFSGCYGTISIENSLASGSHDDPVNVHGTHLRVVDAESTRIKVRFMHHQTWGFEAFEAGDSIGFVDNENLLVYDYAIVKEARMISRREMELELNQPVPAGLKEKHCIENITKTPKVVIRNSRFEHTNTRGLLLTTRRKVLIENNTFYRTGMHAILIANDCNFWYESGPVSDITIRKNRFIECGYNSLPNSYPIAIMPETHNFVKDQFVHSNITIADNEFNTFDSPVLFARSTDNLRFSGNTINRGGSVKFPAANRPMFYLDHCDHVTLASNKFGVQAVVAKIQIENMNEDQVQFDPDKGYTLTTGQK